jgi:hypothetical protein
MAASVAVEWLEQFVKARRRQLTAPDTPELSAFRCSWRR